jgi:membrane associated rhomboid family serine protease
MYSRILVILFSTSFLLNYSLDWQLADYLGLNVDKVFMGGEIWRLILYPFADSSLHSLLLLILSLTFFSPSLEKVFKSFRFPVLLLLIVCLHGLVINLINFSLEIEANSSFAISFFILFSFIFLNINKTINTKNLIINYKIIATISIALGLLAEFIMIYGVRQTLDFIPFEMAALGSLTAFAVSQKISIEIKKIRKSKLADKKVNYIKPVKIPVPIAEQVLGESNKTDYNPPILSDNSFENENRMNQILDLITENGIDSISQDERVFLEEYSRNI